MKTYRINQFKTKEEVMDAIIDVFKRREDWCKAEARRTGTNPEPSFKAQKAYDLAFQTMGGNSFKPGEYQHTKRYMVDYLKNMECLFREARERWLRFYLQDTYLRSPEGRARQQELLNTINHNNAELDRQNKTFLAQLNKFVEEHRNCEDWRVARFTENSVTFGLADAKGEIVEKSALTFYIDRGVSGNDEPTLVTAVDNHGRFSCDDVNIQVVRYAWMGVLLLAGRLKSLKDLLLVYGSAAAKIATAISTANVQLKELGLEGFEAAFNQYELQNW